jgi:hypothetical protein
MQRPSHQRHRDRRGRSFGRQGHRIRRGAGGYLCAFSASDLSLKWKSVIAIPAAKTSNYFEWSSPTVANGKIDVGVSSNIDHPLIRGGAISYDQATGARLAEFNSVPAGAIGG